MNIILFDEHEIGVPLPKSDPRAEHILTVLRRDIGSSTDVGLVNGRRGKAVLAGVTRDSLELDFEWGELPESFLPIDLIVGLSRPQTCRKILLEATSLGVRSIAFVKTDRGEPSYATSRLWTSGEWKRLVRIGAEQAFTTRLPKVEYNLALEKTLETAQANALICLDNYEAKQSLLSAVENRNSVALALGSERGWAARERDVFRQRGFEIAHLGERPLRTETAVVAAVGLVAAVLSL